MSIKNRIARTPFTGREILLTLFGAVIGLPHHIKEKIMIENGQFVLVHYTGTLADGDTFDSTEGREPFEFQIGESLVIPSFENAIKEMAIDEERTIHIKAADAYGERRDDLSQQVPLTDVNQYLDPKEGMVIQVMLSDGNHAPAVIKEVTAETVTLDFNHPLAGKDLSFTLKLVGVNSEPTQEHGCGCGDEECGDDDCESGGCGCGGHCK